MERRTVKHVAARVGLPSRTVRYYDRIGLVSPAERSPAGYRLYGDEDEGRLRFVRQAKGLGLSLDEIRDLLATAEQECCAGVGPRIDALLARKLAEVDARLDSLQGFRDRLAAYRVARPAGCRCSDASATGAVDGRASSSSAPASRGGEADGPPRAESRSFCGCLADAPLIRLEPGPL